MIEKLLDAGDDTVAFLANVGTNNGIEYHGRTNATRAGFDFTCTSDGGQGWTGIVYRDDDVTYRAANRGRSIRQPGSSTMPIGPASRSTTAR